MQVEVTDADRAAAIRIMSDRWTAKHIAQVEAGEADHWIPVQECATHREAARIEGIRLGLEAAAGVAEHPGFVEAQDSTWDLGFNAAKRRIATAIRAIDPAVIGAGQLPQRADSGR